MPPPTLSDARAMAATVREEYSSQTADMIAALADTLLTCATRLAAEYGRGDDGEALADRLLGEAGGA